MTSPVWEFQGIPTKRPFLSWEFQLEFHRFQRREFPPREFQGPKYSTTAPRHSSKLASKPASHYVMPPAIRSWLS